MYGATNGNFIPEMELIISQLERGTVVTKFYGRKRPEKKTMTIQRETREIQWRRSSSSSSNRSSSEGTGINQLGSQFFKIRR